MPAASGPVLTLSFDRGTLRIEDPDGPASAGASAGLPDARWDPRTTCFRAPAYRYRALRREVAEGRVRDGVVQNLQLRISGDAPPLRPYQEEALASWIAAGRRGLVAIPTGAGKTRIAIAAIIRTRLPALVLVPTRVLLHQWASELSQWLRTPIGVLGDGDDRVDAVTVATFESGYRRLDDHGGRFAMLVVDEAHHFGSGARREALEMCVAPLRLGLTATMPTDAEQLATLDDLVGPPVFSMGLGDLLGRHLADLDVVRMSVGLDQSERTAYDACIAPYKSALGSLRRIAPHAPIHALLAELLRSPSGRAAVASRRRAEAIASLPSGKRELVATLLRRHAEDRVLVFAANASDARVIAEDNFAPLIVADVSKAERQEIVERFRAGTYRTIVSARVLNEGFDVPDASIAIVAGSSLGRREHIQRVGRVLRAAAGKRAVVYDIITRGTIEERQRQERRLDVAARTP